MVTGSQSRVKWPLVGIPHFTVSSMFCHDLLKLLMHLLACMPCWCDFQSSLDFKTLLIGKNNGWFKWIHIIPICKVDNSTNWCLREEHPISLVIIIIMLNNNDVEIFFLFVIIIITIILSTQFTNSMDLT